MPLNRRAMGCDDFALGNVHPPLIQREEFKFTTVRALNQRTDNHGVIRGERKQPRIKCPMVSAAQRGLLCAVAMISLHDCEVICVSRRSMCSRLCHKSAAATVDRPRHSSLVRYFLLTMTTPFTGLVGGTKAFVKTMTGVIQTFKPKATLNFSLSQ